MKEYLYQPMDLAQIICKHKMDSENQAEFLHGIYSQDKMFLPEQFREDERIFVQSVNKEVNILCDPDTISIDKQVIERDRKDFKLKPQRSDEGIDCSEIIRVFKEIRITAQFLNQKKCMRMKMRALLNWFGHQKRTDSIKRRMNECMLFYHLTASLKGNKPCDLRFVPLDSIVTFRSL